MKRRFFVLLAATGLVALLVPMIASAASKGRAIQKVPVRMSEFAFQGAGLKAANFGVASKLKAGKTRFVFNNKGEFPHNFTILYKSEGGSDFESATLNGGKKQRRTIDLRAGSYIAVCTVGNGAHAAAGMFINFTVGQQDGETFMWGS
ncbi:MAG: hypothetical protein ACR2OD_05175 [Gaiellaceae bacterium]